MKERIANLINALRTPGPRWDQIALAVVTNGEFQNLVGQKNVAVLNEGVSDHKHRFQNLPWNKEEFGADITDFTEFTVVFKRHLGCQCGRDVILGERGLI